MLVYILRPGLRARPDDLIETLVAQGPQQGVIPDRGKLLKLATDQSAAPGLLAETGTAAAQMAITQLSESFDRSAPLA